MKKKTSVYFVIPILCVLGFAGYYWTFLKEHNQKEVNRIQKIDDAKKAKAAQLVADQEKAYNDALALRTRKESEKAEKQRITDEEKKLKIERKETLARAQQDADKLIRTIDEKQTELTALNKEISDLELQKKAATAEVGLVREAAKQSQENAKRGEEEVIQYERAKQARIEAERRAQEELAKQKKQ